MKQRKNAIHSPSAEEGPTRDDLPLLSEESDGTEENDGTIEEARPLPAEHLKGLIEALVFASDKPLKAGELARLASAPTQDVKKLLEELSKTYESRGIVLGEIAGGWMFRTHAQFAPFVRELTAERPVRLTRAQVETLAIVAYRQPITRPEIDHIRGVDSGATLKLMLERDLVRILGKKDEPGRPLLYGTTSHFLTFFGLRSLRDLPTLKEFTELSEDSRRLAETELGDVSSEPEPEARSLEATIQPPPDGGEHDTVVPSPTTEGEEEAPGS